MARAVANIAVSITARTAAFRKGMKRAIRTLKKFAASVRAMSLRVAKFGSVLAGVAIGGMALFIKQSFKSLDALAKTSQKLGITIDRLRGLERAAELTGGSIEQFRKSIIMMSKNISEAAMGTGEAIEAFELLGVKATDLLGLGPEKALTTILRKLDLVPGSIRRIGIAADIFGARSGTALLNLAALGPKLESTIARSIELVGRFTDVELNLVERANDALGDTFRSLRGIADRLAVTVAPAVEAIAVALTDAFIGFRKSLTSDILPGLRRFFIAAANFGDLFFRQIKLNVARLKVDVLTLVQDVLRSLPFADVSPGLLKRTGIAQAHVVAQERELNKIVAGKKLLLGDRLAKFFDDLVGGAAGSLRKGQSDRAKRQVRNFFAPVLNAIRDPLSVFRAIVEDFNKRLAPFKGKLRLAAPTLERASAAQATSFLSVVLSRQALRAFPGQKREQIVRDRSVKDAIDSMHNTLRRQSTVATFGE